MDHVLRYDERLRGSNTWRHLKSLRRRDLVSIEALVRMGEGAQRHLVHAVWIASRDLPEDRMAPALARVDDVTWRIEPWAYARALVMPEKVGLLLLGAPPGCFDEAP